MYAQWPQTSPVGISQPTRVGIRVRRTLAVRTNVQPGISVAGILTGRINLCQRPTPSHCIWASHRVRRSKDAIITLHRMTRAESTVAGEENTIKDDVNHSILTTQLWTLKDQSHHEQIDGRLRRRLSDPSLVIAVVVEAYLAARAGNTGRGHAEQNRDQALLGTTRRVHGIRTRYN